MLFNTLNQYHFYPSLLFFISFLNLLFIAALHNIPVCAVSPNIFRFGALYTTVMSLYDKVFFSRKICIKEVTTAVNKTSNLIADIDSDITIVKASLSGNGSVRHIFISTPRTIQKCPHCDSSNCVINDSGRKREVWHVPQSRRPFKLFFTQRRYICRECGSTFMEHLDWLHSGLNMTNAMFDTIKHDLLYKLSKKKYPT